MPLGEGHFKNVNGNRKSLVIVLASIIIKIYRYKSPYSERSPAEVFPMHPYPSQVPSSRFDTSADTEVIYKTEFLHRQ